MDDFKKLQKDNKQNDKNKQQNQSDKNKDKGNKDKQEKQKDKHQKQDKPQQNQPQMSKDNAVLLLLFQYAAGPVPHVPHLSAYSNPSSSNMVFRLCFPL